MSEQINDGLERLHQELAALDSSIADLRLEADRLRASAQARSAVALLERSTAPAEPPVWEDSAPAFALDYVPQHIAEGLSTKAVDAESAAKPGSDSPVEPTPETPTPEAVDPLLDLDPDPDADVDDAASTDESGATVLEFPGSGDAVTQEVAGFFAESLRRTDESDEQSPLANLDEDVEAAFDKFFSADVEPEPAQRWLLSD